MKRKTLFLTLTLLTLLNLSAIGQKLHLDVLGSQPSETKTLDSISYVKQFDDLFSLNREVDSLIIHSQRLGYFDAAVSHLKKENDSTYKAEIKLNQQYKSIYLKLPAQEKLLKTLEVVENPITIRVDQLGSTLKNWAILLGNQGDPFASVQLENIEIVEGKVHADVRIGTTTKRKIDRIIVKGYEDFPESFTKYFLRLRAGQMLNLQEIKNKSQELNQLRFATELRSPELLFKKDSTDLYIYVEKNRSNLFDGFLGFGTDAETNKLQFNGYLNLNLINNLNYGEELRVYYKSDDLEQKTFDAKLALPFIFKTPIGIRGGLRLFKKDSTFITATQTATVDYALNSKNVFSASLVSSTSDKLAEQSIQSVEDYRSTFVKLQFTHRQNQFKNRLFPVNFLFDLSVGKGNRISDQNESQQTSLELASSKIFELNERNSLFGALTGGYLISDSFVDNELYRFGGINSIRGFRENSLVANQFLVLNTEYRYQLSSSLYVHSVFDAAYFKNELTENEGKLVGFGFGFGLLTQAGLFNLTYAGGKYNNESVKISDFKIHISLKANF